MSTLFLSPSQTLHITWERSILDTREIHTLGTINAAGWQISENALTGLLAILSGSSYTLILLYVTYRQLEFDHLPILLSTFGTHRLGRKILRFEEAWLREPSNMSVVFHARSTPSQGSAAQKFMNKVCHIQEQLTAWSKKIWEYWKENFPDTSLARSSSTSRTFPGKFWCP